MCNIPPRTQLLLTKTDHLMNDSTRLLFCVFLFLFSFTSIQAATVTAIADGPWDKDIWSTPTGPQPGDSIVIPLDRTVHLNTIVDLSTAANDTETKIVVLGKLLFYNKTFECAACDEVAFYLDEPSYIYVDKFNGMEEYDLRGTDKMNIYFNNNPAVFTLPFGPGTISAANNVLPVELVSFSGAASAGMNKLAWITVSEEQTSHFEVEASPNGYGNYATLGTVSAQGNSNSLVNYAFEDVSREAKTYYRLKMVDLDGSYEYSQVIVIERAIEVFEVSVFPNPVIEDLNVQVNLKQAGTVTVQIFNTIGNLVVTGDYELEAGQHILTYQLKGSQDAYFVQVLNGNEASTQKVLVSKKR